MKQQHKLPPSKPHDTRKAIDNLIRIWQSSESFGETTAKYYENFVSTVFTANDEDFYLGILSFDKITELEISSHAKDHGILMIISTLLAHWDKTILQLDEAKIKFATHRIQLLLRKLNSISIPDLPLFYKSMLLQKLYNNPRLNSWEETYQTVQSLLEQREINKANHTIALNTQYFKVHKIVPIVTESIEQESRLCFVHEKKKEPEMSEKFEVDIYQFSPEHKEILSTYSPSLTVFLEHPKVKEYIRDNPHHRISLTTVLLLGRNSWQSKISEKFPYLKKFLP